LSDAPLTAKHILLDCPDLQDIRQKYFTASSLKDIFESVDKVVEFVIINCGICYPYFIVTKSVDYIFTLLSHLPRHHKALNVVMCQ